MPKPADKLSEAGEAGSPRQDGGRKGGEGGGEGARVGEARRGPGGAPAPPRPPGRRLVAGSPPPPPPRRASPPTAPRRLLVAAAASSSVAGPPGGGDDDDASGESEPAPPARTAPRCGARTAPRAAVDRRGPRGGGARCRRRAVRADRASANAASTRRRRSWRRRSARRSSCRGARASCWGEAHRGVHRRARSSRAARRRRRRRGARRSRCPDAGGPQRAAGAAGAYEELLALEESMGHVAAGLSAEELQRLSVRSLERQPSAEHGRAAASAAAIIPRATA